MSEPNENTGPPPNTSPPTTSPPTTQASGTSPPPPPPDNNSLVEKTERRIEQYLTEQEIAQALETVVQQDTNRNGMTQPDPEANRQSVEYIILTI